MQFASLSANRTACIVLMQDAQTELGEPRFKILDGLALGSERQTMRSLLRKLRAAWRLRRVRKALANALGLHKRGEVRGDGLGLVDFSMKVTVSWRARDVHPWDRDLSAERRAPRLIDQTLRDTEDAVERIFSAFPEANTLELNVYETNPSSNGVIMSGAVVRSDLGRFSSSSIGMRLRMLGINYHIMNQHFEAIAIGTPPPQPRAGFERDFRLLTGVERQTDLAAKSRTQWSDGERSPR